MIKSLQTLYGEVNKVLRRCVTIDLFVHKPSISTFIMPISGKSISLFSIYTLMLQIQVEFKAKYT